MLTLIPDLPPTVVGVEAHGQISSEDYEHVLIPAVDGAEAASSDGKVSLLYVFGPDFPDFTAGAAWEDTKLGLGRIRHWHRIAIVGDSDWLRHAILAFAWAIPGAVKIFSTSEIDAARDWASH